MQKTLLHKIKNQICRFRFFVTKNRLKDRRRLGCVPSLFFVTKIQDQKIAISNSATRSNSIIKFVK
ncbi:MAG: hypothetical protein LBP59_19800 [Planctomycetaceae bacterium]|nr:hypothetical protein [Planctomycetaceae bacterium]